MIVDVRTFEDWGPVGIIDLADALVTYGALFEDLTFRQDAPGSPHRDTKTIYLRMPPVITLQSIFEGFEVVDYPACDIAPFREGMADIARVAGGSLARAMIISLAPGGRITPHIDEGAYAEATHRYHLPVVSNESAWLRVGSDQRFLVPGTLTWFNKHRLHSGANEGATDRIHLVVDLWR